MNRSAAVSQIKLVLGFRQGTALDNQIITQLQLTQQELEQRPELPYFLRSETLTLQCTPNVERMNVPTGFLKEWDEDALWVATGDEETPWMELEKDSPDYLRRTLQLKGQQMPVAYAMDSNLNYILFPTPDQVYTFRSIYYKADTPLTSDIENKWLKHAPYLLIAQAGLIIATGLRDQTAMQVFAQMLQAQQAKLDADTVAQDSGARRYIIGGPD